jgi:hypothetical protein
MQRLIDWNYRTLSARVSILCGIIARRRCLRMYAHASLTLPSYCGVHAVFLLCVALPSRAYNPCIGTVHAIARALVQVLPTVQD